MQKEKHISWNNFVMGCESIAKSFSDKSITTVVGVARGGIIPASIVARHLDADFAIFSAKSYNEKRERSKIALGNIPDCNRNGNILIVDEICDSGNTLSACKDVFKKNYASQKIYTSSIAYKKNSIHVPDFYFNSYSVDEWVIFPWEI
jgi:hypoxanthine phosphoribosyltransferase